MALSHAQCVEQLSKSTGENLTKSWRYFHVLNRLYQAGLPLSVRESIIAEVIRREHSEGSFFYDPPMKELRSNEQLWSLLENAKSQEFRVLIWKLLIRRGQKN